MGTEGDSIHPATAHFSHVDSTQLSRQIRDQTRAISSLFTPCFSLHFVLHSTMPPKPRLTLNAKFDIVKDVDQKVSGEYGLICVCGKLFPETYRLQKASRKTLAREYGISESAISKIVKKKDIICAKHNSNVDKNARRLYFRFITGYRFSESDFLVTVEYLLLNQVKKPARSLVLLVFDISPPICSENLHQLLGGSTVLWR